MVSSNKGIAPGAELDQLEVWPPTTGIKEHNDLSDIPTGTATIHQLFEQQAAKTPQAIALCHNGGEISFSVLNARANQMARYLRRQGVGAETLVGICLERSIEMVLGILAILKAGGAYVPIDPSYPTHRLDLIVQESRACFFVTTSGLATRLTKNAAKVLCLDSDWTEFCYEGAENLGICAGSSSAAYVIFTSGSTGLPKGVMGLHRATVNRLLWMWRQFPFEANEVCCQKTSLSFVDSVCEIFGGLLQGLRTVILPSTDMLELIDQVSREQVTRIVLVPSLLMAVLETEVITAGGMSAVKVWVSSGEELTAKLKTDFLNKVGRTRLLNLYGSTEVAGDVTWHEVSGKESSDSLVPIGRAIDNCYVYVLDPTLKQVPRGVVGEICAGGESLARGYLNSAGETAERFIPDPYNKLPGQRIYRTGDRGRFVRRGELQYKGRL